MLGIVGCSCSHGLVAGDAADGVGGRLGDGLGFFVQAGGGIRDLTVTGVQTCALPISKLYQLPGLLSPRPELSAFVAIALEMPDNSQPPMAAAARFLEAMRTFPGELRALTRR